jgi:hypothetical protein
MAVTDQALRGIRAHRYDAEAIRCPMTAARYSCHPMWNRFHSASRLMSFAARFMLAWPPQ